MSITYEADTEITVTVEIHDQDVIDRCFTGDWQAHYWAVDTVERRSFYANVSGG